MKNDHAAISAYRQLAPDRILAAVEALGLSCDGHLLALNSFENRVYRVGLEERPAVVAKFYRPGRWSDAAIQEEHDFAEELAAAEIPVVAPWRDAQGTSLHRRAGFRFALFPNCGGRAPDFENPDHLLQLGRFVGRLHGVGATIGFRHRPRLTVADFGHDSARFLLREGFIPADLTLAYRTLTDDLLRRVEDCVTRAGDFETIRLHGDCHAGNILWTETGPQIVDLDDARTGPALQDLWMFLSGGRAEQTAQLHELLAGYTEFQDFDPRELHLLEALRTLRLLHYYAWLARRWDDPAFPLAFPWFNTQRCWEDHILSLREQAALMEEPPLRWPD